MAGELLDYVERDNFDFFKFSVLVKDEEQKNKLKRDCERVLEYASATVQDMCLLGVQLKMLKESKTWESVFNPESGYCFSCHSFGDFCEYAFGLSKTRTSNFLRLAEFVTLSGTKNSGFINPQYADYNTSQLVELASVREEDRKYFSPDMSVQDMRTAKDYIKMGDFWFDKHRTGFDLMEKAKAYKEGKRTETTSAPAPTPAPAQLPGQVSLEELEEEETPEEVQEKSDVGFRQEEQTDEFDEFGADSIDYFNESETEDNEVDGDGTNESYDSADYYDDEDIEGDDVVEPTPKYNLKARDGVREFLWDYQNWRRTLGCIPFFGRNVWTYNFKNGAIVTAVERKVFTNDEFDETTDEPLYFLDQGDGQGYVEITKKSLVAWCTLYREEL